MKRLIFLVAINALLCMCGIVQGADGPVVRYTFQNGSGNSVLDISGNGHNGTIVGTSNWGIDLLNFNSGQYVNCGTESSLGITNDMSFAVWVKWMPPVFPDNTTNYHLFSSNADNDTGQDFRIEGDTGLITYLSWMPGAGLEFLRNANPLVPGNIYHLCFVRSGNTVSLYINGGLTMSGNVAMYDRNSLQMRISNDSQPFVGQMMDVQFFNSALTQEEIRSLYSKPISDAESGLVAYYKFDESAGNIVYDSSGYGNTGTIYNGAERTSVACENFIKFDGINDYINCGNAASLDIRNNLTVSYWISPAAIQNSVEPGIVGKGMGAFQTTYYLNNYLFSYINGGGNNTSATVPYNMWTLVTTTYDGAYLRIYTNGTLISTKAYASTINQASSLYIGNVNSAFFKGCIDDVKVYNRVLSNSEIAAQYTQQEWDTRNSVDYFDVTNGQEITNGNLSVRAGSGGGVQISNGSGKFVLSSSYSYPGTSIGYNRLSQSDPGGGAGWNPVVTKPNSTTLQITASGSYFSLIRTIQLVTRVSGITCVTVQDQLTNVNSTNPVGIMIDHSVVTPSAISNLLIGYDAANPMIFFSQNGSDFGIVAEDDLGRLQYNPTASGNIAWIHHRNFALDGGKSYTFKYAIYPLAATGDVFNFVNPVRKDWNANFTIQGPFIYMMLADSRIPWNDPVALKAWIERRNINVACITPWLDYDPNGYGHIMTRSEYLATMPIYAAKIRAAKPGIKVIGSVETDWVTIDPNNHTDPNMPMFTQADGDAIIGYKSIPSTYTMAQASAAIANTAALGNLRWRDPYTGVYYDLSDSIKRTSPASIQFEHYGPFFSMNVYPAPNNGQYNFLMNQNAFIMDNCGLDGFYEDEFSQAWGGNIFGYGNSGELQWDGNSVNIDPTTGQITRKLVDLSYVAIQQRVNIMNAAVSRGKVMVANTFSTSMAEQSINCNRFAETWGNFDPAYFTAGVEPVFSPTMFASCFGSPIGLGGRYPDNPPENFDTSQGLMLWLMQYLRHGMVYYHYVYPDFPSSGTGSGEYGPINHMMPITPIELHKGWIKGQERIVSCVSYTTNWTNTSIYPHVHFFDIHGREIQAQLSTRFATITGPPGNRNITVTISDWAEFAIIETDNADNITPTTIASTKSLSAGSTVYLKDISVSAKIYNPDGSYYGFAVEEPDRFFGIRVITSTIIDAGQKTDVYGTTYLDNGEYVIDARNGAVFETGTITPIVPYSIATIDTCGGLKSNQGAVLNSTTPLVASNALNTVGMLMRIRGIVTAVGDDFFYVNDGYGVNAILDGSGYTGMKCGKANLASLPAVGDHIEVTGVVGVKKNNNYNTRYLWTISLLPATISTYAFYVHSGLTDFRNMISLPAQPVYPDPAILFAGIAINNNLQTYTGGTSAKTYTTATASTFGGINYSYGYSFDSSESNSYAFSYIGYNDPTPLDRWISVPNGTSGGSVLIGIPYNHATKWNDWHATDLTSLKSVQDADTAAWLDTSGDWYSNGIASLLIPGDSLYQNYGYKIRVNKKLAIIAPSNSTLNKSVTGSVLLEDFIGNEDIQIGQIPIVIGTDNGTTNIFRALVPTQITPNSGSFSINVNSGIYNISLKTSHWLRRLTSDFNVDLNTNLGIYNLINGDVVDNNEVDFSDINAVRAAYGSFPGDGNWNTMADVDGSGEVDFTDINIVRSNYGEIGE